MIKTKAMERQQMDQNDYVFILEMEKMKKDIDNIRNVSLPKMERDIEAINTKVDKMDNRIWWVLGILVASTVGTIIANFIG